MILPLADLQPNGDFRLEPAVLEQIFGGPLTDGAHVLHLLAEDDQTMVSDVLDISFTLDTRLPQATIQPGGPTAIEFVDVFLTSYFYYELFFFPFHIFKIS